MAGVRYFAMFGDERRGPFALEELREAGVTPDTYVWGKGMEGWEKAADVPDICRFWRRELARIMHPEPVKVEADESRQPATPEIAPEDIRPRMVLGEEFDKMNNPDEETLSTPPANTLLPAILVTIACFPPTGLAAIHYSILSRRQWRESADNPKSDLRREAHDNCRQAKMWTGISFFIGLIIWAFLLRFT